MTINILTQGLTTEIDYSVGAALISFLNSSDYKSFTFISAFASEPGIKGLSGHIERAKETYESLNIIVGVDQKGTSKEALERLLNLEINTLIFHQQGYSTFHPKIYYFEGDNRSQLIIGSSNLTTQGLFINVEGSIHLELDLDVPEDLQIITDLKARFAGLFDFTDPNLQPITNEIIEQFVAEKIVPTETERNEIQEKLKELDAQGGELIERIIRNIFPKRQLPTAPQEFRSRRPSKKPLQGAEIMPEVAIEIIPRTAIAEPAPTGEFLLVWRSRRLKHTHLQMPRNANTNPKGSFTLGMANFRVEDQYIDHTTYFNEVVFKDLNWSFEQTDPIEAIAIGKFEVIVLGDNWGMHNLVVRYQAARIANQRNSPTTISWGDLGPRVRDADLLGRRLELFRLEGTPDIFRIAIV